MAQRYPRYTSFFKRIAVKGFDDCWNWQGSINNMGYGVWRYPYPSRKSTTAHREMFLLSGGVLRPGQVVRHTCDNPPCCNPDHLLAGLVKDNHNDMIERGRADWQRGHKRRQSSRVKVLTDSRVRGIKFMRNNKIELHVIAEHYNISEKHVSAICRGKRKQLVPATGDISLDRVDNRAPHYTVTQLISIESNK